MKPGNVLSPSQYWAMRRLPFEETWWMPGMPLPTLLPVRVTRDCSLHSIGGTVLMGVGGPSPDNPGILGFGGDRLYAIKSQHQNTRFHRVTCTHPDYPQVLFTIGRDYYSVG